MGGEVMPYPGTALFPQASGLYPGGAVESGVNLWPSSTGLWPAATGLWPGGGDAGFELEPEVVTGSASGITNDTAIIAGSVDPNGLTAHYYVEYGLSTGYGSVSSTGVAGVLPTSVTRTISGLNGASLYHYRMVAVNAAGFGYGNDETFYTEVGQHDAPLPSMRHEAGRIQ